MHPNATKYQRDENGIEKRSLSCEVEDQYHIEPKIVESMSIT